jgi:hypothetical protein
MKKQFLGRGGKMDSQKWEQQQAKLDAMYQEEFSALERKGATVDLLREPVFQDLLTDLVLTKHAKELDDDIDLRTYMITDSIDHATPAALRALAAFKRAKGDLDTAYDLEEMADLVERRTDKTDA